MKKIAGLLSVVALSMMSGCDRMETSLRPVEKESISARAETDRVHVIVSSKDNKLFRSYGIGYSQPFSQVTGYPKAISTGSAQGWEYDPAKKTSGQNWYVSPDVGTQGNLWRLEASVTFTPVWINRSININGKIIAATDIGVKKDPAYINDKIFAAGATFTNGSNIYSFSSTAKTWSVFKGVGTVPATKIDVDEVKNEFNPWCVTSSGIVKKFANGLWQDMSDPAMFTAVDIGCGQKDGIFAVGSNGKLYRYSGSARIWEFMTEFAKTGRLAQKVDASMQTAAVSSSSGELFYVTAPGFPGAGCIKVPVTFSVDDVSIGI
jgi:hypothetical protein